MKTASFHLASQSKRKILFSDGKQILDASFWKILNFLTLKFLINSKHQGLSTNARPRLQVSSIFMKRGLAFWNPEVTIWLLNSFLKFLFIPTEEYLFLVYVEPLSSNCFNICCICSVAVSPFLKNWTRDFICLLIKFHSKTLETCLPLKTNYPCFYFFLVFILYHKCRWTISLALLVSVGCRRGNLFSGASSARTYQCARLVKTYPSTKVTLSYPH